MYKFLNFTYTGKVHCEIPAGWGSSSFYKNIDIKLKTPKREIVNIYANDLNHLLLNKEQLEELDYKSIRLEYKFNNVNLFSYDEGFKRYKENKQEFIDTLKTRSANWQEKQKIEQEKKRKEIQLKDLSKLEEWRNGGNYHLNLPYSALRLNNNQVQTSLGVNITIEEAKNAYRAFKLGKILGSKIAGYNVIGIRHIDIFGKTEKCIIVGCHTIPESEINKFIKFYNLDWK